MTLIYLILFVYLINTVLCCVELNYDNFKTKQQFWGALINPFGRIYNQLKKIAGKYQGLKD